jgi:hypothetical protein
VGRLVRRGVAVTALATALLTVPLGPGATAADPVQQAERELAAVRAEVDRAAATLADGTRRLEAGRTELVRLTRELDRAQREADAAAVEAGAAADRLREVAVAAYRSPLPDGLALALSQDPERYVDAVVARADLARAQGSATDLLRDATAERVDAAEAVREVEDLSAQAAEAERWLAGQQAALQAAASDAERRLTDANARLTAARAAVRTGIEADCSGGGGGANGFLPASALCPLDGAPGHALRADAAAAFNRLTAAAVAERGTALCVNDSYRSYAGQVSVFRRKPRLAAVPGTSLHGLGTAVDLGCGVERFGSSAYRWMKANAGRFGWHHPAWAEPGGAMPEPWHWEYRG